MRYSRESLSVLAAVGSVVIGNKLAANRVPQPGPQRDREDARRVADPFAVEFLFLNKDQHRHRVWPRQQRVNAGCLKTAAQTDTRHVWTKLRNGGERIEVVTEYRSYLVAEA